MACQFETSSDDDVLEIEEETPAAFSYSPEEAARLFHRHLLDNAGQFQQLYDGLFYWKMSSAVKLPSFNVVRPHFVQLLLKSGKSEADSTNSLAAFGSDRGMSVNLIDLLTPTDEKAKDGGRKFTKELIRSDKNETGAMISPRCQEKPRTRRRSNTNSDKNSSGWWKPVALRKAYDNVTPPIRPVSKDFWLEGPIDLAEFSRDFDFEQTSRAFKKIPLRGQAAIAASSNTSKQEEAIQSLFQRRQKKSSSYHK